MTLEGKHIKILSDISRAWYEYSEKGLTGEEIEEVLFESLQVYKEIDDFDIQLIIDEVKLRIKHDIDKNLN
jgi:hypothetical protein